MFQLFSQSTGVFPSPLETWKPKYHNKKRLKKPLNPEKPASSSWTSKFEKYHFYFSKINNGNKALYLFMETMYLKTWIWKIWNVFMETMSQPRMKEMILDVFIEGHIHWCQRCVIQYQINDILTHIIRIIIIIKWEKWVPLYYMVHFPLRGPLFVFNEQILRTTKNYGNYSLIFNAFFELEYSF